MDTRDISIRLQNLIRAEADPSPSGQPPFRVGDQLRLRVLEVVEAGRALVDLGKMRAVADVRFDVAPGDQIEVRVEDVGKQLRLRTLASQGAPVDGRSGAAKPQAFYLSKMAEPLRQDIGRILAVLQNEKTSALRPPDAILNALKAVASHLEPLHPLGDIRELVARLQQRLESSGQFLEKKLERLLPATTKEVDSHAAGILQRAGQIVGGDLKAQLAVLQRYLEASGNLLTRHFADESIRMSRAIAGALKDLGDQQRETARQRDPGQPFQAVMFDLPIRGQRRRCMLKVYFPPKRRSSRRGDFRLSLLLCLDRMGDVRGDFLMHAKDLSVAVYVLDEPVKALVEAHADEIREALQAHFHRVAFTVTRAEQKVRDFASDDAPRRGDKRVDMRV